jgi:hypothetical protein
MSNSSSRLALRVAAIAALAGAFLVPAPAKAWVSFGFALPPVVIAPAYPYPYPYYPPAYPPGYYAPPPPPAQGQAQTQAPAQSPAPQLSQNQVPYGAMCYAGNYTCAAAPYSHVGSVCSCPGWGAPSFGTVQ